jgi:hypothetical protein
VRSRWGIWRVALVGVAIVVALLALARWALLALVTAAFQAPPNDLPERRPADPPALQAQSFELGGVRYAILLPKNVTVQLPHGRINHVEMRYPSPRQIRLFRLAPDSGGTRTYARSETLSNGAVLRYNLDTATSSGSGEPEQELTGRLELGDWALAVMCHDQHPTPSPYRVCVPYLHHLRIER